MSVPLTYLILTTVLSVLVSIPLLRPYYRRLKPFRRQQPFPFLQLPPELRNLVYDHLVSSASPIYDPVPDPAPASAPASPAQTSSALHTRITSIVPPLHLAWPPWRAPKAPLKPHAAPLLVSRQVSAEYRAVLLRRAPFTLILDHTNQAAAQPWRLPAARLRRVRRATLLLKVSSQMLGARDPRTVPTAWPVRANVRRQLAAMERLECAELRIVAVGDPLWNPLWIWYHTAQAFREAEFESSAPSLDASVDPIHPEDASTTAVCSRTRDKLRPQPFDTITFKLECFAHAENHLARNADGQWEWRCVRGHPFASDHGPHTPIREFCAALFPECGICAGVKGEMEGDGVRGAA